MTSRLTAGTILAVALGGALSACGETDLEGDSYGRPEAFRTSGTGSANGASSCDGNGLPQIEPHDPTKYPKCTTANGSARCIPETELGVFADKIKAQASAQASGQAQFLQSCESGFCIPDDLVKSGGAPPKACTSLNGVGVCLDLSIPLVSQYKDLLPQDSCAATERCAPCANPLAGGEPTGACLIGKGPKPGETCAAGGESAGELNKKLQCPYEGPPLIQVSTLAACGEGAHCVSTTILPDAKMASLLKACQTTDAKPGVCAPDEFIETGGNFQPKPCESLLGTEGRCMNVVVPQVESQKTFLPQGTCKANERCTPCFNPVDGKPTGACGQSCDVGPQKPAVTFPTCAKKGGQEVKGVCVPETLIPQAMQSFLKRGTCEKSAKCAPKDVVSPDGAFAPASCDGKVKILGGLLGSIRYSGGVCLSDLIDTPGDRGTCQGGQECVPCTHPVSKKPTGAPGCK